MFVLLAWPKRTKKSRLRLLSYSVSSFRCARRKLASLRQRRSGRSTPFLRLTLTRTRPIQWTIDNWRLTIFFFSFIYPWNLPCVVLHNQITINKNEWVYCVIYCFILPRWLEAQHAAPLLAFTKLNGELNTLCNPAFINFQFSILNFQLFRPNGGGVKRSTERSVKKSRLFEP